MPQEQDNQETTDEQEESADGQTTESEHGGQDEEQGPEGTDEGEQQTFSREYVQKLRDESATMRVRGKQAGELSAALWEARVAASGRLADASDLAMPEGADPLNAESVTVAIEELLTRKPHLASRALSGDVGQGATGAASAGAVDLGGMLRQSA